MFRQHLGDCRLEKSQIDSANLPLLAPGLGDRFLQGTPLIHGCSGDDPILTGASADSFKLAACHDYLWHQVVLLFMDTFIWILGDAGDLIEGDPHLFVVIKVSLPGHRLGDQRMRRTNRFHPH
jgi:hypothetical protein